MIGQFGDVDSLLRIWVVETSHLLYQAQLVSNSYEVVLLLWFCYFQTETYVIYCGIPIPKTIMIIFLRGDYTRVVYVVLSAYDII